jgi:hypothetical protein
MRTTIHRSNGGLDLLELLQPKSRFLSRNWQLAAYSLLLLASVYFFFRGPWRAAEVSVDLPTFYISARAWLFGLNPYDWDQLLTVAQESRLAEQQLDRSLTPPLTLFALSPLATLPYAEAQWLWLALNLFSTGLALFEILRILEFQWTETRTIAFLIVALGLASIHTAISQGQLTIIASLFLVYALKFDLQNKQSSTGLMLALAGILKPQIVLPYGLYYLFRRQWKVFIVSTVIGIMVLLIVVGRMQLAGVDGLQQWWHNVIGFAQRGGDPAQPAAGRYLMMNLQVVLHQFIQSRLLVNVIVFAVVGAALLVLATVHRHDRSRQNLLLTYSCLAALAPLALYSRIYSATLLLFPLAWALFTIRPLYFYLPTLALLCIFVFLVPGTAILNVASQQLPPHTLSSWWWKYLLLPHQSYALFLLAICLFIAKFNRGGL